MSLVTVCFIRFLCVTYSLNYIKINSFDNNVNNSGRSNLYHHSVFFFFFFLSKAVNMVANS